MKIFERLGIRWRINNDGTSAKNVSCSSFLHTRMFNEFFGKGAGNKKAPYFLFKSPKSVVSSFLKGYLRGDGHRNVIKGGRCFTAATVSRVLAQDILMLAKKIGIISSICLTKQTGTKGNYEYLQHLSFTGENIKLLMEHRGKLEFLDRLGDHNKSHWFGSYLMRPIVTTRPTNVIEKVYNLEVEDVNSYVVEGIVVHNCITGSHDLSYKKTNGANIVRALCKERSDLVYRGDESASFTITGRDWFNVNLLHPAGGRSYSLSYKPQKQTESLVSAALAQVRAHFFDPNTVSKGDVRLPTVLLIGHYHSTVFMPSYLGVDSLLVPSFQAQTSFLRRMSLFPQVGFIILTIEFDDKRNITKVVPDFRMMNSYVKERDF